MGAANTTSAVTGAAGDIVSAVGDYVNIFDISDKNQTALDNANAALQGSKDNRGLVYDAANSQAVVTHQTAIQQVNVLNTQYQQEAIAAIEKSGNFMRMEQSLETSKGRLAQQEAMLSATTGLKFDSIRQKKHQANVSVAQAQFKKDQAQYKKDTEIFEQIASYFMGNIKVVSAAAKIAVGAA